MKQVRQNELGSATEYSEPWDHANLGVPMMLRKLFAAAFILAAASVWMFPIALGELGSLLKLGSSALFGLMGFAFWLR